MEKQMIKYIKLFSLFEGFLKTLDFKQLNSYEKKLVNLIKDDFDNIAEVGTYQGKRAELLVRLIEKKRKVIGDSIDLRKQEFSERDFPLKKITLLEIELFRGFNKKESFAFDKQYTLVYGPNGSGKSCFCDALEYALLGYINEAIAKRIEVDKYIVNANVNKYTKPLVKGLDQKDNQIDVQEKPDIFDFCLFTKNKALLRA